MRIGIVARDFPPGMGGMQNHAEHVARELAKSDEVVVYTLPGLGLPDPPFEQRPILSEQLWQDTRRLPRERVDAWLCLEACYASIAPAFPAPVFVYFYGNDFLKPRLLRPYRWLEMLRTARYFWRYHRPLDTFLGRRQLRLGLHNVAGVFTDSSHCAHLIRDIYDYPAVVAHPGVNEVFFQQKNRPSCEPLQLLTVARLTSPYSRKNIDGVLQALRLLPPELSVRHTIVGDGPDRPRLEALVGEWGLQDRVCFAGSVSQQQLLAHYRQADLFILASKAEGNDVEGFGIVYLEAAASGTPSLCSRAGGATDAVEDGVNGLLIPDSSPQSIADGITRFAAAKQAFPETSVRTFAERFRWPGLVAAMRAEMAKCLTGVTQPNGSDAKPNEKSDQSVFLSRPSTAP